LEVNYDDINEGPIDQAKGNTDYHDGEFKQKLFRKNVENQFMCCIENSTFKMTLGNK